MNKVKILLGASTLLFNSAINAALIEYSISGTAFYYPVGDNWFDSCPSDTGCSTITGSLYISDVRIDYGSSPPDPVGQLYEVSSFSFNVGDYSYGGDSGTLTSSYGGTYLTLWGTGELGYDNVITMRQEDRYFEFPVLPWSYTFDGPSNNTPGITADGLFESWITSFSISKVSPVPIPSAVWLFGSGLLGLVGVARRKQA